MARSGRPAAARRPRGDALSSVGLAAAAVALSLACACTGGSATGVPETTPRAGTTAPTTAERTATPDATPDGAPASTAPAPTSEGAPPSAGSPTSAGSPSSAGAAGPGATDWFTYHRTNDRAGAAAGVPAPRRLSAAWSRRLDGAVYGQPLVVGSSVVVATENDSVFGLERTTGAVRWRRGLGTPVRRSTLSCGNIDPLGITGTPAYDPGTGSVFVVTETTGAHHTLVALRADTGAVRWRRDLDVLPSRDRHAEQQRGALAVAGGRVYVPFGGLAGDCGNYVGYVTATSVSGRGSTAHYEVPTRREGGIWAPSGVAVSSNGDVWVAVGNGASTSGRYDGSDSVLRLQADLGRRLDFFAPRSWGQQNAADLDLGSTGPLLVGRGRVLVSGKDGNVYLLDSARLGGIGGQLDSVDGCSGFGGLAYDAARQAAFVPCGGGVLRLDVGSRDLRRRWQAPSSVQGSPVIGGGAVWTLDAANGLLLALSEDTGRRLARTAVDPVTRFASPVLTGPLVLVGTRTGVQAFRIG